MKLQKITVLIKITNSHKKPLLNIKSINLPKIIKQFTLLRSPFVNKKSQEKFFHIKMASIVYFETAVYNSFSFNIVNKFIQSIFKEKNIVYNIKRIYS